MNKTFPKSLTKKISVDSLVQNIGGVSGVINTAHKTIHSVASLDNAKNGSLVFCNQTNIKHITTAVKTTKASVIIVHSQIEVDTSKTLIVTQDPLEWFIKSINFLFDLKSKSLINKSSDISKYASIGKNVSIGAGTLIEDQCIIGDNSKIGANCYIGQGTIIGDNVFIQSNTRIGGVGLGYHFNKANERIFFPHLGAVVIGCDVVIGSGCVITRGQMQDTTIFNRTRIGNLVNIGHNVTIREECSISSSSCIAGGVIIESKCNIAAGVIINAKINIGENSQIGLGSVVTKDVPSDNSFFGNPAKPLPTMRKF